MSGGTDCEASRATGPSCATEVIVTGTSMSENGVPNRYGAAGTCCRSGDRGSALSIL